MTEQLRAVVPSIGVSFNFKIDDRREIVAQTHIDRDASAEQVDGILDKVRTALERQKTISDLADFHTKLEYDELKLKQLKEDFVRIDQRHRSDWENSSRRGDFKLGPKEQGERNNALSTIDRYEQEIALDKKNIEKCEAKLAKEPQRKVA